MKLFTPGIFLDTFQESFRNKMFLFFSLRLRWSWHRSGWH